MNWQKTGTKLVLSTALIVTFGEVLHHNKGLDHYHMYYCDQQVKSPLNTNALMTNDSFRFD